LIKLGRVFHVERLMGALVVVALEELVEARLLLEEVGCGGFGGFFLEREMHAFMAAILLGMAGLDALDVDTESLLKPKSAWALAKGTPLSVRIAAGNPNSRKVRSNAVNAKRSCVVDNASHVSR
jgi:hypothetical protein